MNPNPMDLATYLRRESAAIEGWLEQHLPAAETPPCRLHEAMRYAVLGGGKRLRPILTLAVVDAFGASRDPAILPALALEVFHAYTLIHDDLPSMDDDDLRRGKPSCHRQFDEATAILAGDALQALAFAWMARAPDPGVAVERLARLGGSLGVVGGQAEDLRAEQQPASAEDLLFIHTHKTADLIRCALETGAQCAGCGALDIDRMGAFGHHLGLAFQITDDILDETATTEVLGKPAGSDRRHDKATFVKRYGLAQARAMAEDHLAQAMESLQATGARTQVLEALAGHLINRTY